MNEAFFALSIFRRKTDFSKQLLSKKNKIISLEKLVNYKQELNLYKTMIQEYKEKNNFDIKYEN